MVWPVYALAYAAAEKSAATVSDPVAWLMPVHDLDIAVGRVDNYACQVWGMRNKDQDPDPG